MLRVYFLVLFTLGSLLLAESSIERLMLGPTKFSVAKTLIASPYRSLCHADDNNVISYAKSCEFGNSNIQVAVFGDSHGVELSYSLSKIINKNRVGLRQHTFSGCPPRLNLIRDSFTTPCSIWTAEILENLMRDKQIKWVILTYRIQYWIGLERSQFKHGSESLDNSISLKHLIEITEMLLESGKNVILVDEVPFLAQSPEELLFDRSLNFDGGKDLYFYTSNTEGSKMDISSKLNPMVHYIDPSLTLCEEEKCLAVKNFKSLYFDDNHISIYGANLLSLSIIEVLSQEGLVSYQRNRRHLEK
jgi:hypothetical protein